MEVIFKEIDILLGKLLKYWEMPPLYNTTDDNGTPQTWRFPFCILLVEIDFLKRDRSALLLEI